METTFRIPNREIAMAAFESLCHEGKKDAALKLAGALLKHTYIYNHMYGKQNPAVHR